MKIVILDGKTVVGNEMNFDRIKKLGELTVYDRTPDKLAAERIGDAEIVFTNKTVIGKEVLDKCKNLKLISVFATGYNVIDVDYAREKGVVVCNVPAYSTDSVAQLTFAFILEIANRVGEHNDAVHGGRWLSSEDFCFWTRPLTELAGKTLGIVGYGNIGKRVVEIAKAFKMNVLVTTRTPFEGSVTLDEVLENSDFVSLHCPMNKQSDKMINAVTLSKMKPTAYLINTSRGGLVDEQALADALNSGRIAGAAVDVVSEEPINASNPLLTAKNCIVTPHIAWAPLEARRRLMDVSVKNLEGFLSGNVINQVNK